MENPLNKFAPQLFGSYPSNFKSLLKKINHFPNEDIESTRDLLWKAYEYGSRMHQGQKRSSGEPFFNHCVEVAITLATWKMDLTTIMAGLLHDTVEDTSVSLEDIEIEFGADLANLVDGLTKLSGIQFSTRKDKQAGNFMKMFISVAKDLRVIIVKFADRLHNMSTIKFLSKIKQRRIAIETRDVYAPLAHRLGMSSVKSELDDLVFMTLDPINYNHIKTKLKSSNRRRNKIISSYLDLVKAEMSNYKINQMIYGRHKSNSSIYNKMVIRNKRFEEIYDLYALRIIVDKVEDCYLALGVVHNLFTPIQERFKDFIANPKTNGYQSVHTTVIGVSGKMIEFQIRTKRMEETAEIGIAAHWIYKDNGKSLDDINNVKWLRDLLDILKDESTNPKEFMDLLKIDLFDGEIFVFTPAGDLIQLPENATPVDFAFQVHSQVGLKCMGAKVNHNIVPLNSRLNSGDLVEIITSNKQRPNHGWQKFVVTSKAKTLIAKYLKETIRNESIKLGTELLNKSLRRLKIYHERDKIINSFKKFSFKDISEFKIAIGRGLITIREILLKLDPKKNHTPEKLDKENYFFNLAKSNSNGILIEDIKNMMFNFGKCCNPIPGDNLVGFITKGRGITIHQSACKNLPIIEDESDRLVEVEWNLKKDQYFNVRLKIIGLDYKGLLKNLSECIVGQNINITSVDIKVSGAVATAYFIIQIKNNRQLKKVTKKILTIPNIDYIERA